MVKVNDEEGRVKQNPDRPTIITTEISNDVMMTQQLPVAGFVALTGTGSRIAYDGGH